MQFLTTACCWRSQIKFCCRNKKPKCDLHTYKVFMKIGKKGAEKAARTRKAKSQTQSKDKEHAKRKKQQPAQQVTTPSVVCSTCLAEDPSGEKDEEVDWICCDSSACWRHMVCVGIITEQVPTNWQCLSCIESWE